MARWHEASLAALVLHFFLAVHETLAFGACPQGPQTPEEANLFNVQCNDTDVVVYTVLPNFQLSTVAVPNKSLTVYGYRIVLGDVNLRGGNLTLVAPFISCDSKKQITLNTTGLPAPELYAPGLKPPIVNCPTSGCPGVNGNSSTTPGGPGGRIAIYAEALQDCNQTSLQLVTTGGLGQRGQDGGDGVVGYQGAKGTDINCDPCHDNDNYEPTHLQCSRRYPLLTGGQVWEDDKIRLCAANYDPIAKTGDGRGQDGGQGGLPGLGGNSTYGGSAGNILLPATVKGPLGNLTTSQSHGLAPPAVNGNPGPGGPGGPGGRGEKSFFSYYGYPYHQRGDASCVGEDSACTPPPGNQGPPGCSLNATDSNSCALLSQPQAVGFPPADGTLAFATQLGSALTATQLDMIVTTANNLYFNQNYEEATRAYHFLYNFCKAAMNTTTTASLPKCNLTQELAAQGLNKIGNGFDFYGQPANYVPLVGLSALNGYVVAQLQNFEVLEKSYQNYYAASTTAADKQKEVQNSIDHNSQNADKIRTQLFYVLGQQKKSTDEYQVLVAERAAAKSILTSATQAFKDAVARKENEHPDFLDWLGLIATTVVAVGADVAGVGKITGDFDKVIPGFGADKPRPTGAKAISGICGATTFVGSAEALYPKYTSITSVDRDAQTNDIQKMSTDSKQFKDYLAKYKDLPEAKEYNKDIDRYQRICDATSGKVFQNTAQYLQSVQLQSQLTAVDIDSRNLESLAPTLAVNPAAVQFAAFISGAYKSLQQSLLASIYQMNQVTRYAFPGTAPQLEVSGQDFTGLTAAHAAVLNKVQDSLALTGGGYLQFKQYDPFVINASTPGFAELLRPGGSLKFYISADNSIFYDMAQFYASAVSVEVVGEVQGSAPGNTRLDVDLNHLGTPTVINQLGQKYTFVHNSRPTVYSFEVLVPSHISTPGYLGGCGSGTGCSKDQNDFYIGLSPFTWWEMNLPGTFDYSKVTAFHLRFEGQFLPLHRKATQILASGFGSLASSLQFGAHVNAPGQSTTTSFQAKQAARGQACTSFEDDIIINLDLASAIKASEAYDFLIMDNGEIRMPLPTLNMSASLTATPALPLPFDSSTGDLAFGPISAELGSVAFKSIGDNLYEAKLPASLVKRTVAALESPSVAGLYKITAKVSVAEDDPDAEYPELAIPEIANFFCASFAHSSG